MRALIDDEVADAATSMERHLLRLGLDRYEVANPEEREPEDNEDGVCVRLGIQELPPRREKDSAGYSSRGSSSPWM